MHPHIQPSPNSPNSSNITIVPWIRRCISIRPPVLIERAVLRIHPGTGIDSWRKAVIDGNISQRWPEIHQIVDGEGALLVEPYSLFVISTSTHMYIYLGKRNLQSHSAAGHNPRLDWPTQAPYCPVPDQRTTAVLNYPGAVADKRWYQSWNCSLAESLCYIGPQRTSVCSGIQPDTPA